MAYFRFHIIFEAVIDISVDEDLEDPKTQAIAEVRDLISDPTFEPAKVEDWSNDLPAELRSEDVP